MRLDGISRILGTLQRTHARHSSEHLVLAVIPQALEHVDMLALAAWLLEDLAKMADDDGVGGDDQRRLALLLVVDLLLVHHHRLLRRRLEHVFEGGHVLGQVLGEGGWDDFDVREADLQERAVSMLVQPGNASANA